MLYCDEGLMLHSGMIFLVAYDTQAKRVLVLGDTKQFRYACRLQGFLCNFSQLPLDVSEWGSNNYIQEPACGLAACAKPLRRESHVSAKRAGNDGAAEDLSMDEVVPVGGTTYIRFTQSAKNTEATLELAGVHSA